MTTPSGPSPDEQQYDEEGLRAAQERTGRMLRAAGLPFDADELDETDTGPTPEGPAEKRP